MTKIVGVKQVKLDATMMRLEKRQRQKECIFRGLRWFFGRSLSGKYLIDSEAKSLSISYQ